MSDLLHNTTFVLFAILFTGLLLGNIKIYGLSLGSSGVLFVALLAGHYGLHVPDGINGMATALFVYCVGLSVGNRFFGSLIQSGNKLVILSIIVVSIAALITILLSSLCGINAGIAAGMFAGACTSTPALAAATEAMQNSADVNIGYGIAYPFGVVGVVLFVQLFPRFLKVDISQESPLSNAPQDPKKIISRLVLITNSQLMGHLIATHNVTHNMTCRITRIVKNDRLIPLSLEDKFELESKILLVGTREDIQKESLMLGILQDNNYPKNSERERTEVIALKKNFCNHSLRELKTLQKYGITISRISRLGFSFVPSSETIITRNDILTVVGSPSNIEVFKKVIGHRSSAINMTDILSLAGGIALGILLGSLKFSFGTESCFSLGIAGGPLIVALILGHFGHIGPFVGYIPRPTRTLLMEFGLILFLAWAGVTGGEKLVSTLKESGLSILIAGFAITTIPMFIGYFIATRFLKLNLLESLGGICGGMTSTPALGAITNKTDAHSPVVSYATAYPAALILMTIFSKIIINILN